MSSVKSGDLLPGFCRDKSVQPVLTVFREGVLNGAPDTKETSANGLSEVITLSDAAALKPHVVNVTGPLIRVLGDRYPPNVKSAILATLALLLEKVFNFLLSSYFVISKSFKNFCFCRLASC